MSPGSEPGNTIQRLLERYNTFTRRPVLNNEAVRATVFKCFARVLGPWLPEERSASILDVGCGEGALLLFLREAGYKRVTGFDVSPENVAICHDLGLPSVRRHDALCLHEFEPGTLFDVIFITDVLEHLPKSSAASFLADVRARLRPGGFAILQTPNMGCVFGQYHRFNDLSHEFCVTEKSAVDLMMVAGFDPNDIEIRPAWNATTLLGRLREKYLMLLHHLVFLAEDSSRPKIPTKNLLIRAWKR